MSGDHGCVLCTSCVLGPTDRGFVPGPAVVLPEVDLPDVYLPETRAPPAFLTRPVDLADQCCGRKGLRADEPFRSPH
ncbi:hypothetical protein ACFQ0G_27095 [Streptomyces chiangmaiensis]